METNEQALNDIIGRLERSWQGDARRVIKRLYELLDKGMTTEQAVNKIKKEFPALFLLTGLQDAMVEAAAYGYGIMPSILTKAEKTTLARSLSAAWTSDRMTLSEKLHGLGVRMRDQIVHTINEQMDKNATWKETSLALYDGYTGGGDIIRPQEVPQYIQKVIDAANDAAGDAKEIAKQAEQAAKQAEQLAKNGAPTTALQAAYNQVVEAAESGSQEALEKAVEVAVNEKSRYVADRIIRTESARAYNNGFLSKVMADDDVVALRWKLNTRHPVFDICDMFAKADMFGLGPGIFPKDNLPKTSIPVHPHCMCRFVEVYDGEVDMDKMVDRTQEAGEEWLKKLNDKQQRMVLGVQGQKQFAKDGSWQDSMRGWFGTGKPDFTEINKGYGPIKLQLHGLSREERRKIEEAVSKIPPELDENGQPTSKYLKAIANTRRKPYNKEKQGYERFFDDNGDPVWPPNNGAAGPEKIVRLKKGDKIYRRGGLDGGYASEMGATIEQCSLPKGTKYDTEYIITIKKDVDFHVAAVAPWFDMPGGALQYRIEGSFFDLLEDEFIGAVQNV